MAEAPDINVDELRRRARRRLIGAVILALAAAVIVPMLLETDPKPLGEDVSVKIPPEDNARFVNRLSDKTSADKSAKPATASSADPVTRSPGAKDAAKDAAKDTAKDTATTNPQPDAAPPVAASSSSAAGTPVANPPSVQPTNVPPPKKSIAQAEQKMLGATGKPAAPTAAATPSAPALAPATPAAPPTASADAPKEGFSVQLAAFADDKGANSLANKLKKAAYPAYTEPLTTSKGTLWRVRVGPYASRDEAVGVRDKLKGEGYSGIVAAAK